MAEKITRIQWGPSGITVYSSYGMVTKVTAPDELETLTEFIGDGLDTVEMMRKKKKEAPNSIQIEAAGESSVQRGIGSEDEASSSTVGLGDEPEILAGTCDPQD